jgi:anti-sigma regulatory factor (Ser/Thr protein kinase)
MPGISHGTGVPGTGVFGAGGPAVFGGAAVADSPYDADASATAGSQVPDTPVPVPPFRQRDVISGPWPFRDTLELGALPGAVPCARLHARHVLWEWARTWPVLSRLGESVELLVSELVTNAVAVSRSADRILPVRLWLLADRARALVLVRDASSRPPIALAPSPDAESGRGMMLVEAMSERWDWYPTQDPGGEGGPIQAVGEEGSILPPAGKVVWALAQALTVVAGQPEETNGEPRPVREVESQVVVLARDAVRVDRDPPGPVAVHRVGPAGLRVTGAGQPGAQHVGPLFDLFAEVRIEEDRVGRPVP